MPLASLEPLRHRDFALVWWAGLVSNAGSWMQTVAVGAFVTSRTGRAGWAGLAAAAAFLPIGLLAPIGGALADRLDRRRFIMVANLGEASMAAVLVWLVVSGRATPASLTAVVFVAGCMGAVRLPFYQAMTPDLVPREQLLAAASLGSAQFNLGRVFGPTLAGAVIAIWGYEWAFAVNAVSFFAVIVAMALVRIQHVRSTDDTGLFERIRIGVRAARANPGARSAIVLIGCVAFLLAPFIALISARAFELAGGEARRLADPDGVQEATAAITGYLTTAQGAGAVIGALLLAPLAMRVGRRRLLLANVTLTPIALAAYAYAPNTGLAVAALAIAGMLYIGILSGANNVVQLWAPPEFRGRILSLYLVALGSVYPVGGLIQGSIADRIGLPLTTSLFAAVMFALLVYWRVRRPSFLEPLTDPDELARTEPTEQIEPRSVA